MTNTFILRRGFSHDLLTNGQTYFLISCSRNLKFVMILLHAPNELDIVTIRRRKLLNSRRYCHWTCLMVMQPNGLNHYFVWLVVHFCSYILIKLHHSIMHCIWLKL